MTQDFDLNSMSGKELKALLKSIDKAIVNAEARAKTQAFSELSAVAKAHGFSLEDLLRLQEERQSTSGTGRKRKPATKVYAHPTISGVTWTGRGRKPRWFIELEENGQADTIIIRPIEA